MKILFKKLSDMPLEEEVNFNNFYMFNCVMPLFPPMANYRGDETACILFSKGNNLINGRIIGILLYRETEPNSAELARFKARKMFAITRIDVHEKRRNRGHGTKLLEKTIGHLTSANKKPFLIKMEQIAFPGVPERLGFEKVGRNYYYRLIS